MSDQPGNLVADSDRSTTTPPAEVVITMAGGGTRFLNAGYSEPKFMIKVKGLPLFMWSLLSLTEFIKTGSRFTFIAQQKDQAGDFITKYCEMLGLRDIQLIEIQEQTDGQATTALLAQNNWLPEAPLAIYNIDTYIEPGILKPGDASGDGWIPCFNAPGEHWSFVKLAPDGLATEVREKQRISNHCTIGLYWFSSCNLYKNAYNDYYCKGREAQERERYVAPLYNQIIQNGGKVRIFDIPKQYVHVLGTPQELESFS